MTCGFQLTEKFCFYESDSSSCHLRINESVIDLKSPCLTGLQTRLQSSGVRFVDNSSLGGVTRYVVKITNRTIGDVLDRHLLKSNDTKPSLLPGLLYYHKIHCCTCL
jgi:hypothetical protein